MTRSTAARRTPGLAVVVLAGVALAGCSTVATTSTAPTAAPLVTAPPSAPVVDLQVRPVLDVRSATPGECPSTPLTTPAPAAAASLCSQDRTSIFSLAPAELTGQRVTDVSAAWESGYPVVELRFDPQGAATLSRVTGQVVSDAAAAPRLALVSHGRVQKTAAIIDQITDGVMVLSGFQSGDAAQQAADFLQS